VAKNGLFQLSRKIVVQWTIVYSGVRNHLTTALASLEGEVSQGAREVEEQPAHFPDDWRQSSDSNNRAVGSGQGLGQSWLAGDSYS
jgi:hypothetical protein